MFMEVNSFLRTQGLIKGKEPIKPAVDRYVEPEREKVGISFKEIKERMIEKGYKVNYEA